MTVLGCDLSLVGAILIGLGPGLRCGHEGLRFAMTEWNCRRRATMLRPQAWATAARSRAARTMLRNG